MCVKSREVCLLASLLQKNEKDKDVFLCVCVYIYILGVSVCVCTRFSGWKLGPCKIASCCAVRTCLLLAAQAGWNHVLYFLNCCLRSSAVAGISASWGVRAGCDYAVAEQDRSWFFILGGCCGLDLALSISLGTTAFLWLESAVVCLRKVLFLYRDTQEVLFPVWSNECKAMYCLLLPEDITHLIFFCLGWEGEAGWIKSL